VKEKDPARFIKRYHQLQDIYQPTEDERFQMAHFLVGYLSTCLSDEEVDKALKAVQDRYRELAERRAANG